MVQYEPYSLITLTYIEISIFVPGCFQSCLLQICCIWEKVNIKQNCQTFLQKQKTFCSIELQANYDLKAFYGEFKTFIYRQFSYFCIDNVVCCRFVVCGINYCKLNQSTLFLAKAKIFTNSIELPSILWSQSFL